MTNPEGSSTIKIVSAGSHGGLDTAAARLSSAHLGLLSAGIFIVLLLALRYLVTRYKLSLKGKMHLVVGGVMSLLLVYSSLSYFSIFSLRSISGELEEISRRKLPIISYVAQITGHQTEQKVYFERYLRTRAAVDRQVFLSFDGRIKQVINSAKSHVSEALQELQSAGDREVFNKLQSDLGEIEQAHQVVIDHCGRLLADLTVGSSVALSAVHNVYTQCAGESENLSNKVVEFLSMVEQEVDSSTAQAISAENYTIEVIISIALFSLAWGIFVVVSIWRSSMLVLRQINTTIQSLHQSSQDVGRASDTLMLSSTTLEGIAATQASTVGTAMVSLARNEEIMSTNLARVATSNELSQKISAIATKAEISMDSLVDSMNKITESNERIQQLVTVIEEIGEKTKIIEEIVFQTKLLSFNTSVEAERAGEHGRGFAVIAQEVGKLAQMSGSASKEISHMVTQTKESAQVIARENRERVKNGNQLVQETGVILKEISSSSHTVIASAGEILQTSKEQEVAIVQLTGSLGEIKQATQQNLAMAQKTAQSSTVLNEQSKGLGSIVADLLRVMGI